MKKIVTIGGGTGQYTLLRGLKNYDIDLTAIVSMFDNGGSTGRLRVEFGILAPGDLRNCLIALSDESEIKELKNLFEYRFPEINSNLSKHSLGNLILTALTSIEGDSAKAVKAASKILNIKGKILPVTLNSSELIAKTDSGKILNGQIEVSYPDKQDEIKNIWLNPESYIYKQAAEQIRNADLIIICPGDLYGSVIPNFLVKGVKEALKQSKGKIAYVCNLVTKQGSHNFKASDFVKEIEKYCQKKIDYIILNNKQPTKKIVDKYKQEESYFVVPDLDDKRVIKSDLLTEYSSDNKKIARHDLEKTAREIMKLI